jgi:fimbrial chaperone protein
MKTYFKDDWGLLGTLFACVLACAPARAMNVNPMVVEMTDSGSGSRTLLRVTNDGASPIPLEFVISRLELAENGNQTLIPALGDFLIFPPAATIPGGKSQTFRVQWKAKSQLQKSQTYWISVNQLPVKFPSQKHGVQVIYNVGVLISVMPPNATAVLDVTAAIGRDKAGVARPQVIVENKGNRHINLADTSVVLSNGKWMHTVTSAAIRKEIGVGLIQPGKKRRFTFLVNLPVPLGTLTARLNAEASGLKIDPVASIPPAK